MSNKESHDQWKWQLILLRTADLFLILGTATSDVFTAADIRIQKTIEYNLR